MSPKLINCDISSNGWLYFCLHQTFAYIKIENWTFAYKGTGHLPTAKLRTGHSPTLQNRELDIRLLRKGILDICLLGHWTFAYTKLENWKFAYTSIKSPVQSPTAQQRALDICLHQFFLWTFAYSSKMNTGPLPSSKLPTINSFIAQTRLKSSVTKPEGHFSLLVSSNFYQFCVSSVSALLVLSVLSMSCKELQLD